MRATQGYAPDSDADAAITGLLFPAEAWAESADYMPNSVVEELIEALEADQQVTGTCAAERFITIIDGRHNRWYVPCRFNTKWVLKIIIYWRFCSLIDIIRQYLLVELGCDRTSLCLSTS